jgi:hypothetical protein
MREQQHRTSLADRETPEDRDELSHLSAVVLVGGVHVRGGIEQDERRRLVGCALLELLE